MGCWSWRRLRRSVARILFRASRSRRSAVSWAFPGRSYGRLSDRRRPSSATSERRSRFRRSGPWSDKLDQLLLANEGKASRERLTLIRLFEELRGLGYDGGYDAVRRYARRWSKERGAIDGRGLCAAELCAGRSLPVRLEPRGRPAERRDGDREGGPRPALPQPHAVRAGLSARDAGDGVRRPRPGVRAVQGRPASAASTTT